MRLTSLLPNVPDAALAGPREANISGIAYDSRAVQPGDLFVALPGLRADGHGFIAAAVAHGAAAVLCQRAPETEPAVPHVVVSDARKAMADVAAAFYGYPARRLGLVGITGTDGKTTTGFLVHALLQGTGHAAGLIGTVAFKVGDSVHSNTIHQTTPEAPDVQRLLAEMVEACLEFAVIEASSHALMLERLRGCPISTGILTNITSDHLDFHGTLENYRAAKARLFSGLVAKASGASACAILNRDDASYEYMCAASAAPVLSYGLRSDAAVRAHDVEVRADGIRFRASTPSGIVDISSPLTGRFNVYNLLAALAFAVAQDIPLDMAATALAGMQGVPGRMQRIDEGQPFSVVVDFAHTPDALMKVLDELRPLTTGRLIAVFGAPGERDRTKRPLMGRIAAERADLVILTDDDPRSEDRHQIIAQIASGARNAGPRHGTTLHLCADRREAILLAVRAARPGDTVLLAGKGHEDSITIGTHRMPWDEAAAARDAISALGAAL